VYYVWIKLVNYQAYTEMYGQQNIKIRTLHSSCHPPGARNYEMVARFSECLYIPDWFFRSGVLTSFYALWATCFPEMFVRFYKVVHLTIHYFLSALYAFFLVRRRSRVFELQGSPDKSPVVKSINFPSHRPRVFVSFPAWNC